MSHPQGRVCLLRWEFTPNNLFSSDADSNEGDKEGGEGRLFPVGGENKQSDLPLNED